MQLCKGCSIYVKEWFILLINPFCADIATKYSVSFTETFLHGNVQKLSVCFFVCRKVHFLLIKHSLKEIKCLFFLRQHALIKTFDANRQFLIEPCISVHTCQLALQNLHLSFLRLFAKTCVYPCNRQTLPRQRQWYKHHFFQNAVSFIQILYKLFFPLLLVKWKSSWNFEDTWKLLD